MTKGFATQMMFLALSVLAFAACGKSGGDNGGQVAAVPANYAYVNGICTNTANNTQVAYTYCQGVTAQGGYVWNGSQCLVANTSQVVATNLCTQSGYGYGYGYGYQVGQGAGGPYIYNPYPNGQYPIGYFPTGYPSFPGWSGYNSGTYYTSQICVGAWLQLNGGSYSQITCDNYACRGTFVYAPGTYRRVLCL